MKGKQWMVLVCMVLALAACGQEAQKKVSENPSQQSASKEQPGVNKVRYQGNYYSVQGADGQEIIIVNKKHPLNANYAPGEDPKVQAAFKQLVAAMQEEGFPISDHYSGYRSYENQSQLYQNYVAQDGQAEADRYSARPGYSEHQTGLAYDLIDTAGNLLTETRVSQWLREHAADYGFIVRYTEDKEEITGYTAESWHIRYIGSEAKKIAQSGLSLEEYFEVPGGDYED
ncbi:LD-carboxypeptidase LdcB/DacB [Streptococcus danieliae]|uniref:LD-carboxypeptidase LdcB/DacB n=1 Tax=Streptococcus danieliae TaxID=747656 RepID=UPI0021C8B3FD|nr:LD-carboxypeptidase LdcB/DacB [Streptococcus danieliae]MCU0082613.1 M15 family metallopeptidase [Streptococcus danieliae]